MAVEHGEMSEPKFFYYDELASTNQKMKELTRKAPLPDMSVVIAHRQYAGRGQVGNSWESEPGKNLTFSMALNPTFVKVQDQFLVSQAISVGITDALLKMGFDNVKVKWPNDIYAGHMKLAGILIENSIMGDYLEYCIVGIGLNVNQTKFLSNAPNPTSMAMLANRHFELNHVLESVLDSIYERYLQLQKDDTDAVRQSYLELMYLHDGQLHPFSDFEGPFMGKINGIDTYGRLQIEKENGTNALYEFKEIGYVR
ncbi:MAG: biotin--[acetyl-CoA-carboxylase] ligase [Breznakibacter sp.]